MIETPRIVQSPRQQTAVIRLTIPRDQIRAVMGPAIGEVIAVVSAQGIGPTGPVYSHHFCMDPATFDFEVGVPVSAPVKPTGRVKASELPAAKVLQTTYRGPYEGLGAAWGEFQQQIAAEGQTTAENLWERYVAGPESSPDPSQWQTELNRPLKSS